MKGSSLPYPPLELAQRVGSLLDAEDPYGFYDELGRLSRDSIVSLLPERWSFDGKRVLDFGCGAGRTLRHFIEEAPRCEFWACDIDAASVAWLDRSLCPPFRVFRNEPIPPLKLESESFDLVYAVSVFTHLTDSWSSWLLELDRILAPNGLLLATFIGPGAAPQITAEPWVEDQIGMNVLRPGQSWESGGPMVLHSPWWIQAHWGRTFDIVDLRVDGFAAAPPSGQGAVMMRKREASQSTTDPERPEADEPRELKAASWNVQQLTAELIELRPEYDRLAAASRRDRDELERVRRRVEELEQELARVASSRSWRLTHPLRAIGSLGHRAPFGRD